MKPHNLLYFVKEGLKSVFQHGFMSFACVTVIVACLIITGSFSLLALNVDAVIGDAESSSKILVFVDDTLDDTDALALASKIYAVPNVLTADFESREQALEEYALTLGEESDTLLYGIEPTDLRHRYRVTLSDLSLTSETVAELEKLPGVGSVQHSIELTDSVLSLRSIVNAVSYILAGILVFVSIFIIANTVKLATFDRREEIAIMRMVGATGMFIRIPFIVEGSLLGLTGGGIAYFAQLGLYHYAGKLVSENADIGSVLTLVPFASIAMPMLLIFLAAGFVVGVGGGMLTIRKFMRV